jgi:hypothetical protein
MTISSLLSGWTVPEMNEETHIRRYSTTADILSYKRCRRQYGFFGVRGFSSATATQRYFGTLVHDVLDRINRDYASSKVLPDRQGIELLIQEAHDRLIRSGVRPYNAKDQQAHATKLIDRFVHLIGPQFFKHVQQTEYRLERALQTHTHRRYILSGIVDVLSGSVSHDLGLPYSTDPGDIEIWDYKSGRYPDKGSPELQSYEYQIRVYAELYRQQTGDYPARSVLVFIGELGDDDRWNRAGGDPSMFPRLVYPIHPIAKQIEMAMQDFHETVEEIEVERAKPYANQWLPPSHAVSIETCEACEIRYSCSSFKDGDRQKQEPL